MCGNDSGGTPRPVSETLIVTLPPAARLTSSRTRPPASVYLTALSVSTTISSRRRAPPPPRPRRPPTPRARRRRREPPPAQPTKPVRLRDDIVHRLAVGADWLREVALQQFAVGAHDGQRRPELMRGVRDESALGVDGGADGPERQPRQEVAAGQGQRQASHDSPAEHQQEPLQRLTLRLRAAADLHQQLAAARPLKPHNVDPERVALRRLAVREGAAIRHRALERPLAG